MCIRDRVLHAELVRMTDIVTSRIRSGVGGAKTWSIKVRLSDFTTLTRSHTWSIPIASTSEVIGVLDRLLVSAVNSRSVRLLGVSASGFGSAVQQLDLFSTANVEQGRKDDAIDRVRDRFVEVRFVLPGPYAPKEMRIPRANVESRPVTCETIWRPSARR